MRSQLDQRNEIDVVRAVADKRGTVVRWAALRATALLGAEPEATVSTVSSIAYSIAWDSSRGTTTRTRMVESHPVRVVPNRRRTEARAATPAAAVRSAESLSSPYGPTKIRLHFKSDGGLTMRTVAGHPRQGALQGRRPLDRRRPCGGLGRRNLRGERRRTGVGSRRHARVRLLRGAPSRSGVVQQDPCFNVRSFLWVSSTILP